MNKTTAGALSCAVLAYLSLLSAVFMSAERLSGIGILARAISDDEAARVAPFIRGALVLLGILLILVPRFWRAVVWPEVALLVFLTLAVVTVWKAASEGDGDASRSDTAALVTFDLGEKSVVRLESAPVSGEAVLVILKPDRVGLGRVLTYQTSRYEVELASARAALKRDADDETVRTLAADLEAASKIYVLPPASQDG